MCVQYIRGCSVHWGDTMSTSGDIMSTLGDIMSTSGDVQYTGDIMMHVGMQVDKSLSIETPNILNIPQCTHDIP